MPNPISVFCRPVYIISGHFGEIFTEGLTASVSSNKQHKFFNDEEEMKNENV